MPSIDHSSKTIAFIDLAGSTAAYQSLDAEEVAGVISKITHWIGRVCEAHGGRIVKFLGDGVMAEFESSVSAVAATSFVQQQHSARIRQWPDPLRMSLKIGLATGPVVHMGNDSYGDAVNVAARLSDMSGPNAIWATQAVIRQLESDAPEVETGEGVRRETRKPVRHRALGPIRIRGLSNPHPVFQIEWNDDIPTDLMTVSGHLHDLDDLDIGTARSNIVLAWLDINKLFDNGDLPIEIGRAVGCAFLVSDPRVSRRHARIEWVNGRFLLTDLSTYGTWVKFSGDAASETQLRRDQCILHSGGEMALGAPFSDPSAPVLSFKVHAG